MWLRVLAWGAVVVATAPSQAVERPATQLAARGRVVDDEGRPLAGARVGYVRPWETLDGAALLGEPGSRSAGDGSYRLTIPSGPGRIVVQNPGHQSCVFAIEARSGQDCVIPDAVMVPGYTIGGVVADTKGEVLAAAVLEAECDAAPWFRGGARTDAEGRFVLHGVPVGAIRLTARKLGYGSRCQWVGIASPIRFELPWRGIVRGTWEGSTIPWTLRACGPSPRQHLEPVSYRFFGKEFAMTVPPVDSFRLLASGVRRGGGAYSESAFSDPLRAESQTVEFRGGVVTWSCTMGRRPRASVDPQTLQAGVQRVAVRGRVEFAHDIPAGRLLVGSDRPHGARAPVAPDGAFELHVSPGRCRLVVRDAATGYPFRCAGDILVADGMAAPVLRPEILAVDVQVRTDPPNMPVLVDALRVDRRVEIPWYPDEREQRWLVSPGALQIHVVRSTGHPDHPAAIAGLAIVDAWSGEVASSGERIELTVAADPASERR